MQSLPLPRGGCEPVSERSSSQVKQIKAVMKRKNDRRKHGKLIETQYSAYKQGAATSTSKYFIT